MENVKLPSPLRADSGYSSPSDNTVFTFPEIDECRQHNFLLKSKSAIRSRSGFSNPTSPVLWENPFLSRSVKESFILRSQLSVLSYLTVSDVDASFLDISDNFKNKSLKYLNKSSYSTKTVQDLETDPEENLTNLETNEEKKVTENTVAIDDQSKGDLEDLENGDVEITINHVHKTNLLNVTLHRAKIMPYINSGCKEIFAKIYLTPIKTQKQSSKLIKIKSGTCWNETFVFKKLTMGQLETLGLKLKFYSKSGSFKKAVKIGEACIQLNDVNQKNCEKNILVLKPTENQ